MKENIIAFAWALILTAVVVVIINSNSGVFEADVLQGSSSLVTKDADGNDIVVTMPDMELSMEWWNIVLKSNRDFTSVSNLTLELSFDSSKITLDRDNVNTDYNMSLTIRDSWDACDISFWDMGDIKKWDTIFSIEWVGDRDIESINVWQVLLSDLEGGNISLSVYK